MSGRHARSSGTGFYKDVLLMVGGIVVVGAIVFGGLSVLANGGEETDGTVPPPPPGDQPTSSMTLPVPETSSTSTIPATSPPPPPPSTTQDTVPATTVVPARPPGEVRVLVLNSTDVAGQAVAVTESLASLGYQMLAADNFTPEQAETMIWHAAGFDREAQVVREQVSGGRVEPGPELAGELGADVVVVLGLSFGG